MRFQKRYISAIVLTLLLSESLFLFFSLGGNAGGTDILGGSIGGSGSLLKSLAVRARKEASSISAENL